MVRYSRRAFVATAKPGGRFTVHHIYNPLGVQVRDMSVFVDDDQQGYLVAASNVAGEGANATLTIFKLNDDYTDVTGIANKVMEGEYREAPHIVKKDGFYYLFFSEAAGWYPSRGGYVSSRSLEGRWSEPRPIGNTGGNMPHGQNAGFLGERFNPLLLDPEVSSPVARAAFDLTGESAATKDRYGRNRFGINCLLARRLIERGVRFVTVNMFETVFHEITWDIHGAAPFSPISCYRDYVGPMFDNAYTSLLEDLHDRGLLRNTLVVATGEFGREPKINSAGG